MQQIPIVRVFLHTEPPLSEDAAHLLRGCIANLFPQSDWIHNHDVETGAKQYRYPLVQFKIIEHNGVIVGVMEEGVAAVKQIVAGLPTQLSIGHETMTVIKCGAECTTDLMGEAAQFFEYQFLTPWIGLNTENFRYYKSIELEERPSLLARCVVNNCLSFATGLRYRVNLELQAAFKGYSQPVNLKGTKMAGFQGQFLLNFIIPDLLGIGKSVSRGYGCVARISPG